jgi:hypothetical protein
MICDFLPQILEITQRAELIKRSGKLSTDTHFLTGYINNISLKSMYLLCPILVTPKFSLVMERHGVSTQKSVAFTLECLSR